MVVLGVAKTVDTRAKRKPMFLDMQRYILIIQVMSANYVENICRHGHRYSGISTVFTAKPKYVIYDLSI